MNVPADLRYSKEHEWISLAAADGIGTVGISDHAQEELGDVVFVDLPEVGSTCEKDGSVASLESVKAVSEIYSPVSGEIIEINETLADTPETLNADPYSGGWIYKIRLSDTSELDQLMSAEDYTKFVEEES